MAGAFSNFAPSTLGRVVALCVHCGKRSKPCKPNKDGEPDLFEIGSGWSEAPYPPDLKHDDGSTGSTWTCPPCNKRLRAGETLLTRDGKQCRQIA